MMKLALYCMIVSALYAVLTAIDCETARALTVLFVALIVVPAVHHEIGSLRRLMHHVER